jgi:hypothetical protein
MEERECHVEQLATQAAHVQTNPEQHHIACCATQTFPGLRKAAATGMAGVLVACCAILSVSNDTEWAFSIEGKPSLLQANVKAVSGFAGRKESLATELEAAHEHRLAVANSAILQLQSEERDADSFDDSLWHLMKSASAALRTEDLQRLLQQDQAVSACVPCSPITVH